MPSPLGLVDIGNQYRSVASGQTSDGVNIYRTSNVGGSGFTYKNGKGYGSIFNNNRFYYRPTSKDENGFSENSSKLHGIAGNGSGNDIYDISTNSIIKYTSQYQSMILKPQDFAYLKDFGVYPNNRLVVLRRFKSPVGDDLTSYKHSPISTMITWFKGEKSPLKISFGEKWESGQGNLVEMLDNMFNTSKLGGGLKSLDSFFKGGVPLPGFSEGLQYQLLQGLGMTDKGLQNVPSGNPNLIQESKKRQLVSDSGGSAMDADIDIDFETVYEQKFIGGNDPTLVYMDIINNVLRMGSSESNFYINGKGGATMKEFFKKFQNGQWLAAIAVIVRDVVNLLKNVVTSIFEAIEKIGTAVSEAVKGGTDGLGNLISGALSTIAGATISKFRVQLGGIISSLTGEPSTPWHVTIGNPKAPIFSTGDMYTQKVTIELGETLAFNDLPSTITVSCSLKNARSLGIQEIFQKFNTGRGRSYVNLDKTSFETPVNTKEIQEINRALGEDENKGLDVDRRTGAVSNNSPNIDDNISEAGKLATDIDDSSGEGDTWSPGNYDDAF